MMHRGQRGMAVLAMGAAMLLAGAGVAVAEVKVDPNLPDYKPVKGVSGSISSVGSDTMNNLMTFWGEAFVTMYPNVGLEILGKGSSTAMPALIEGTANFGPMSRAAKDAEADQFEGEFGYKPTQLPTAIDLLAVYVNKDNPIAERGLSFAEVDAIFSSTRRFGHPESIERWGQVGLTGDWAGAPINLFGRNDASGTYGFFKKVTLGDGQYKDEVQKMPGSAPVVQAVGKDPYGIGYSGIGYKTPDVDTVPLAQNPGDEPVPPTAEHAFDGTYPLARFLLLTVNYQPGQELDPLRREFIKFIFSKQGQEIVLKDGYYPVPAPVARRALEMVGIEADF